VASLGPGSRVAGYLIEAELGRGGMGTVFYARHEASGQVFALKVISVDRADDPGLRDRFLREARELDALKHSHVIPIHDAGSADAVLYIATRYVLSGDLAVLLHRNGGTMPAGRAAALIEQVASALDMAHAAGRVHRDVKPGNILVEALPGHRDHAYLSDFGLVKVAGATTLTATGTVAMGTPGYISPEQIDGSEVDGRADQYSLACVAFELLTGQVPYSRDTPSLVYAAHMNARVPSASAINPAVPPAADQVLRRAMAKRPADRFGSCGEFAAGLRRALTPPGYTPTKTTGHTPTVTARPNSQPRQSAPPAPDRQREARQRWEADQARLQAAQQGQEAQRQRAAERRRRTRRRVATTAGSLAAVAVAGVVAATVLPGIIAPPTPDAGHASTSRAVTGHASTSRVVTSALSGSPIATDGTHLWAIDGSSVEELNASNGSVIRTLSGSKYQFGTPTGIAAHGTYVWVANGSSLTEVDATNGAPINVLWGGQYALMQPIGIADDGTHLWITSPADAWVDPALNSDGQSLNQGTGSVVELNASNGSVIRTLSGSEYQFNDPVGITSDGTHVWVTNEDDGRWVVELNASNGRVIRTLPDLSAPGTDLMVDPFPGGIATDGTRVWVVDSANSLVTELNAGNGSFIRTLSGGGTGGGSYPWDFPNSIAAAGTHVWVTSNTGLAELTLEKPS
jgi:serine/threonine protein kinase